MKIIYLKHSEINFEKYNNCIEQSLQSRIYALSWYLSIVSPGWELLMADDYSYVMPIPIKKKFLLSRNIIQSSGCQQLGIFSTKEIDAQIFTEFIDAIPAKSFDLRFNSNNFFQHPKSGICTNYILDLNQSYDNIRTKYKKERVRILETAQDVVFEKSDKIEFYWDFISENCNSNRDSHNLKKFESIFKEASDRRLLEVQVVKDTANRLKASVCLIKWRKRLYYLFPASVQQQSLSYLLDECILKYANNELILDFVASSSPVTARFIESFGAVFEPYPRLMKK